jgi:hypothetical protein
VSAEIVATLATSGATTIVQAAATDAWSQTKRGFARLLGRGDAAATAGAEADLEQTSTELATRAGDDLELASRQQRLRWEALLLRLLLDHPDAQAEMEQLLSGAGPAAGVHVEANAYDNARQNILGSGTQNVTFH